MKKFYLAVALSVTSLFLFVSTSYAQPPYTPAETYETVAGGGLASNPATWAGGTGNIPSVLNPCSHCHFILHGTVTIDVVAGLINGGLVDVTAGTTVIADAKIILLNGSVINMFANTSLIVTDELDLNDVSFISIADNTGSINTIANPNGHTIPATSQIAFTVGAGVYYIFNDVNHPAAPALGSYDIVLFSGGWGDPIDAPGNPPPVTPASRFYQYYDLNCVLFPPSPTNCAPGVVFGPATTGFNAVFPADPLVSFNGGSTLPVTLVQFIAQRNEDGTNQLSWATSQEVNASHYDVERSGDGSNFEKIGSVAAKGFSSITTNYVYVDQQPLATTNYYRLKMVDLDGKFEYSKIASISGDTKGESLVIYNNPFTDMIRLKINTNSTDNLTLTVTDMLGKIYFTQSVKARSGDNFININPGGASGLYILHIQGRGYDRMVKLVKQ